MSQTPQSTPHPAQPTHNPAPHGQPNPYPQQVNPAQPPQAVPPPSPAGPKSAEGTRRRIGNQAMALAGNSLLFVIIGTVMRLAHVRADLILGFALFSCLLTLVLGIVALLNRQMRGGIIGVIAPVVLVGWLFILLRMTD